VLEFQIQPNCDENSLLYAEEFQTDKFLVDLYQDASSETSDVAFSVGKKLLSSFLLLPIALAACS